MPKFSVVFLLPVLIHGIMAKSIQNDTLDAKIASLENIVDRLEARINKTEKEETTERVVFYARLTSDKTLNTFSIIQFNSIIIDIGGHYNANDGIFVAPVSGVYMFSWTTLTFNGNTLSTELRVENTVKGVLLNTAVSSQYTSGSTSLVYHVNIGNHVWVQTSDGTSKNYILTGRTIHHLWDFYFTRTNLIVALIGISLHCCFKTVSYALERT